MRFMVPCIPTQHPRQGSSSDVGAATVSSFFIAVAYATMIDSGVKTMLQILSGSGVRDSEIRDPKMAAPSRVSGTEPEAALSAIGIQRLVLQPMDARLEYLRCLRVWLRENGWHITQVTARERALDERSLVLVDKLHLLGHAFLCAAFRV